MHSGKVYLILSIFAFVFYSCSNPESDYREVQKLLDMSDKVIQQTADYDIKIQACDNAINVIQKFLGKYKEGEWSDVAHNNLSAWESRRSVFLQEKTSLFQELFDQLLQKAMTESNKRHILTNVESIRLENRSQSKEGYTIEVKDIYAVRLKGAIIGRDIFKLLVEVSGRIDMSLKKVFVNNNASIEE